MRNSARVKLQNIHRGFHILAAVCVAMGMAFIFSNKGKNISFLNGLFDIRASMLLTSMSLHLFFHETTSHFIHYLFISGIYSFTSQEAPHNFAHVYSRRPWLPCLRTYGLTNDCGSGKAGCPTLWSYWGEWTRWGRSSVSMAWKGGSHTV